MKSGTPLQTRVGIATGLVVVGDLIGSGAAKEQAVVGETPNIAARLQSIADPNAVVIAGGPSLPACVAAAKTAGVVSKAGDRAELRAG